MKIWPIIISLAIFAAINIAFKIFDDNYHFEGLKIKKS